LIKEGETSLEEKEIEEQTLTSIVKKYNINLNEFINPSEFIGDVMVEYNNRNLKASEVKIKGYGYYQ